MGQQLTHVQGEILIKLNPEDNPIHLLKKYKRYQGKDTRIKIQQVIEEPMNVWSVLIDFRNINETAFEKELLHDKKVLATQPNYLLSYRRKPNDPLYNNQWQFTFNNQSNGIQVHTNVETAWDIATGGLTPSGDTIVVCIIDDGVARNHEDMEKNLWINRAENPGNGMDDDGNGYVDDYFGWDAINDDDNVFREGGHGTSVAGLAGAIGNNGIGITGVSWNSKLMIVRGGNTVTNALKAYTYPYIMRKRYNESNGAQGAYVVATNASWGFDNRFASTAPIFCEFYDHLGAVGILNSTATTNRNVNVDEVGDLPTNCPSLFMIGTTAMRMDGQKITGAGFGKKSIDLAAPSENVYSTRRPNMYGTFSGTSAAAPLVAGTIGLLYSMPCKYLDDLAKNHPHQAALLVRDVILGTVFPNPGMKDLTFTEGNLDIGAAASSINEMCADCTFPRNVILSSGTHSTQLTFQMLNGTLADVRYRKIGDAQWININNIPSSAMISNLNPCTRYEIQLRSNCPAKSAYSYSYYFETDGCCDAPIFFTLEESGNSVLAQWNPITAAQAYLLEFRKVGDGQWFTETTTSNSMQLNGFSSCTGLEFRIRSICNGQPSLVSSVENFALNCDSCQSEDYCSDFIIDNELEWIEEVIFGDFRFKSGRSESGYGNYIGLPGITFRQEENVNVKIVPGFGSGAFREFVRIYIDWNQDGQFDTEEIVFSPSPASDTLSGVIKVPAHATPGLTRMRVILSFDAITSPCNNLALEFGEIEDYCVTIQSIADCNNSPDIDQFNTTSTGIQLILSEISSADAYVIQYRINGAINYTSLESSSSIINITDLIACSMYDIRVAAFCNGQNTGFSTIRNISTRCGTSVDDVELHTQFSIYPNPFSHDIFIHWQGGLPISEISVFDLQGRKIKAFLQPSSPGIFKLTLVDNIPQGMYLLHIESGQKRFMEKVIKL